MKKSKSSRRWLDEHFTDVYVKRAQQQGYRSRAAFKLLEIQEKDKLIKSGMNIIDLGATPGGWSEIARKLMGAKGRIIAVDLLEMVPLAGVEFIQGDFTDPEVLNRVLACIDNDPIDLVMSDMAPNISGIVASDQAKVMNLAETALEFTQSVLRPGGNFLIKVFQGAGFENFIKQIRKSFHQVKIRKPRASRARSNEVYLLALDKIYYQTS